jgi:hypothetical protein
MNPAVLQMEAELTKHFGGAPLKEMCLELRGSQLSQLPAKETSVRYVSIDDIDIDDGFAFFDTLTIDELPSRAKYVLEARDILVSNVRPERNAVSLVSEEMVGSMGSSGFTRLRIAPQFKKSVPFLFGFLKTKHAVAQLMRRNRGSMYPAVLNDDVLNIVIPSPNKALLQSVTKRIEAGIAAHKRFFETKKELDESIVSYLQVELGDPPPSPLLPSKNGQAISIQRASSFFSPESDLRFDAEFFRKEYLDFSKRMLARKATVRLGDGFDAFSGGPPSTGDQTGFLLKQAALSQFGINWNALHPIILSLQNRKDRIQAGDILQACTAHEIYYVGRRVDYVDDIPKAFRNRTICVPDVMIIRRKPDAPEKLSAAFLSAFLRTPWGLHQVQRLIRGLRGGHVYGADIQRNVLIPVPSAAWHTKFEVKFSEMRNERRKAIAAVKDAVQQIENWLTTENTKAAVEQLSSAPLGPADEIAAETY